MKSCFVIMPISDVEPYGSGHFKRVYEHIIKPACERAGFQPVRADDILNTNYIAIDVVKRILTSEMAICDLSSRNPNVFYELGVRQAFNLPVTIIKDARTDRVFDIQGFRDVVYDENLRIDNVESAIDSLVDTLTNTYESRGQEINSLISLLGIQPAQITSQVEISKDTEIILNALSGLGTRLQDIEQRTIFTGNSTVMSMGYEDVSPLRALNNQELKILEVGQVVYHQKFGKGTIVELVLEGGNPNSKIATVAFEPPHGPKKIMVNYAKLYTRVTPAVPN